MPSDSSLPTDNRAAATFAERAKAARLAAGLTQQQLSDRLRSETPAGLDTSAITRIEAGQREPRLSDAIAIAQVLGFGLDNLVPRADLEFYVRDIERLMKESRETLVKMLTAVDPLSDFVRRNPDFLGDDPLEDRLRRLIDDFHGSAPERIATTRSRSDQKLKRQLLRAVSDGILVDVDDLPPPHERWFKEKVDEKGEQRQGWRF